MSEISKEALKALDYANKNHDCIEWIALDTFRVWYQKITDDGLELCSKEFQVKEVK